MKDLIRLIRPKQWIKSAIVFAPVFFGGGFFHASALLLSLLAAIAFSFVASSIYCLNDIIDVEADRRHPVKCHRSIASGRVSVRQAYMLMAVMALLGFGLAFLLPQGALSVAGVLAFYWFLNIAYCLRLKQYAIIDVCIVAFGFVLRLLVGSFATGVVLSKWIVLMTFLLMLFLSFAKRRDDVVRMNETGEAPRKNTIRYNLTFINQAITITASVTLVCYIMYTMSPEAIASSHSNYLYLTSVYVVVGLMRYIQLAVVDKKSGDPTKVMLYDHVTQVILLAWCITYLLLIYFC